MNSLASWAKNRPLRKHIVQARYCSLNKLVRQQTSGEVKLSITTDYQEGRPRQRDFLVVTANRCTDVITTVAVVRSAIAPCIQYMQSLRRLYKFQPITTTDIVHINICFSDNRPIKSLSLCLFLPDWRINVFINIHDVCDYNKQPISVAAAATIIIVIVIVVVISLETQLTKRNHDRGGDRHK